MFFDNLKVNHARGRILEENHYYAYGLKIAGISYKAADAPLNAYQYQGNYSNYEEEPEWNDFYPRTYDPQTGRWLQQDPCRCWSLTNNKEFHLKRRESSIIGY